MVRILVYAYATGVFSSRRIARTLGDDAAFRVLGAGSFAKHPKSGEFPRRHLADVAGEMGLEDFGKQSIDRTKLRANPSKRKAMSNY